MLFWTENDHGSRHGESEPAVHRCGGKHGHLGMSQNPCQGSEPRRANKLTKDDLWSQVFMWSATTKKKMRKRW